MESSWSTPPGVADCFVAIDYFEKVRLPFVVAVNQFDGRENLPLDDVRAPPTSLRPHPASALTLGARSP